MLYLKWGKMKVRETSLEAFEEIRKNLGERQKQVYEKLKELGMATNKMLSRACYLDINSITPRVFELREKGLVTEAKVDLCPITKRKAIWWICK